VAGTVSSEVKAEPNMTPLLDVVFQLITFFMLVINFSKDSYDQRIKLPVAGSARPVEPGKTDEDRITLNIDKNGNLFWQGDVLESDRAARQIANLAKLEALNAKVAGRKIDPENLPTIMVIRADRDTAFSNIYRLITACQANGFRKFALKAMTEGG
jgi:biopolymer transport protein ExbD